VRKNNEQRNPVSSQSHSRAVCQDSQQKSPQHLNGTANRPTPNRGWGILLFKNETGIDAPNACTISRVTYKILGEQLADMSNVIAVLNEERARVAHRLAALDAAIKALSGAEAERTRGRKGGWKMSAATKAKLSKAAKARWAKIKR
jgi:hypothetical protein